MTDTLPPGSIIGILGGGQLGRMLSVAASRLGFRCHVYEPGANPPAGHVADRVTTASYDDAAALRAFADSVDVITYEFENIPTAALDLLDWPMSNAHRIDLLPLRGDDGAPTGSGGRRDGQVFPVDERHEVYWDLNPWALTYDGKGTRLREGFPYLLAYYMGQAHGFIASDTP